MFDSYFGARRTALTAVPGVEAGGSNSSSFFLFF